MLQYREDVPEPVAGPGETRAGLAATGINNTDIWTREGRYCSPDNPAAATGLAAAGRLLVRQPRGVRRAGRHPARRRPGPRTGRLRPLLADAYPLPDLRAQADFTAKQFFFQAGDAGSIPATRSVAADVQQCGHPSGVPARVGSA